MNAAFHQITCRGVSHTPECTRLSTWMFSGVCDTPLHWLFEDIHYQKRWHTKNPPRLHRILMAPERTLISKNFIGKNSLDRYNIIVFHRDGRIYRHIV